MTTPTHQFGTDDDALFDEIERTQDLLAAEIERQEKQITTLQLQIKTITSGPGYHLFSRLWPLWHALVPPHSSRERFVFESMQAVSRVRTHGIRAWRRLPSPPTPKPIAHAPSALHARIAPPRVSVLCLHEEQHAALAAWGERQTWPSVEVVHTNAHTPQREAWGDYVCIGSDDLLQQPETWLETSLITLEREQIAFTLSLFSTPAWITLQLRQGRLPGDSQAPLLRHVVRADCVRWIDGQLRLSPDAWLRERETLSPQEKTVVGRVLRVTTNRRERFSSLPLRAMAATEQRMRYDGEQFIATQHEPQPAPLIPHTQVDQLFEMPPEHDERPTVLVFMPFLAMGGAERIALDTIRHLSTRIRFVVVVTDSHDAALGTTADRFRAATPHVYTAHDFLPHEQSEAFITYLTARFEPRCLYIANGSGWLYDALARFRKKNPNVRLVNQVYDHRSGWIKRYDAELSRLFDANIGTNQKICEAYVQAGVPADRALQIEHPIDAAVYDPSRYDDARRRELRRAFGLPEDGKVVAFIARLHPQKRPLDFIEVARQMRDESGVKFLMVGDGPLAETVINELSRMNLPNFVRRPFYEPSADVFAIADVIMLPSEYEGMPVVVLEAQVMGKPVVVTDVGNTKEVLAMTGGGIVVPRIGDVHALRAAVQNALQMELDVVKVRATLTSHFGAEIIAERYARALLGEAS
jgi:glycosyltransferase involved in cell wall biosynthesis